METKFEAIIGSAGVGKMNPFTEPVCTPEGFKLMGDIKVGSKVIAEDGTVSEVIQTFPQSDLNIYKVTFSDDTFSECCETHLWKVQTKKLRFNNKFKVLSLKEMMFNLNKRTSKKQGYYYSIPLCNAVEFYYQPLSINPYVLGYLLGNGYLPVDNCIVITTHKSDVAEIHNYLRYNLPENVSANLLNSAYLKNTNTGKINLSSTLKGYLSTLGLLGKLSGDKFVPDIYKYNSVHNRLELLKGLMDSDGTISIFESPKGGKKKVRFNSSSLQLAEDVVFLVRSLGGLATLGGRYREDKNSKEYYVQIRMPNNPFKLQRKAKLYDSIDNYQSWTKQIVDVEYIGQKDGQCILVNHPSHTYLTRDFIVTHNTYVVNQRLKEDSSYCFRTATTGVAAVNMSSTIGGNTAMTINGALGYFNTANLLYKVVNGTINPNLEKIAKFYKYLALDEISMCQSAQLDLICLALDNFNKSRTNPLNLLVSGDAGQLPAVEGKPFFESKNWHRFDITYLTEVKRQQDKDFIQALLSVRQGNAKDCIDWFIDNVTFDKTIDKSFSGSTFFSKNTEVDKYNFEALSKLPSSPKKYFSTITGVPSPSWKDIPQYVELKQGSLVQILVNNLSEGYANGDMGFIEELHEYHVILRLLRTGRVITIPFIVTKNSPIGSHKSIGTIRRMPLRLAYATTIHKSQGLTLDAAQIILTKDNFLSKLSGGLYTALSRVRSKEGLRIVGTKDSFISTCFVDPRYKPWIK